MFSIEPKDASINQVWNYLLCGVAPRPIALVSTISDQGISNISPFSFFNAFGSNPPVVAFSASRRGRDGTLKDTYNNIMTNKECVIHAVTYSMVEQVNLASCEYPPDVDEFAKSGFKPIDSDLVKPKRIAESPFQMECRLMQMVDLGGSKGSGNLAICEVVKFHISEDILENAEINPLLVDQVARNGGNWYTRANIDSMFKVQKPGSIKGIGLNELPDFIINSNTYTANNLGRFALVDAIPILEEVKSFAATVEPIQSDEHSFERYALRKDYSMMLSIALYQKSIGNPRALRLIELSAKTALESNDIEFAWKAAIIAGKL